MNKLFLIVVFALVLSISAYQAQCGAIGNVLDIEEHEMDVEENVLFLDIIKKVVEQAKPIVNKVVDEGSKIIDKVEDFAAGVKKAIDTLSAVKDELSKDVGEKQKSTCKDRSVCQFDCRKIMNCPGIENPVGYMDLSDRIQKSSNENTA
jgi:hypothetical protein